jgi:putative NADPH-quinone reductase
MRAVLIIANPNPDGFSHALAERAIAGLTAAGHQVLVHDLYAEGFGAAMSAEERQAYHGEHPALDPLVVEHIADLTDAEIVVFVYPTWWSSVPAILKGWFERVLVPGTGFMFDGDGKVKPGLTNVRRLVGISTYGSPWVSVKITNDNGRRIIMRAMRLSTGLRTRSKWLGLYAMDTVSDTERASFLDRVERKMARL